MNTRTTYVDIHSQEYSNSEIRKQRKMHVIKKESYLYHLRYDKREYSNEEQVEKKVQIKNRIHKLFLLNKIAQHL
jgi:hypothetical protein